MRNDRLGSLYASAAQAELYRDRVAITQRKGALAGKTVSIPLSQVQGIEFHEKNLLEGAYLLFRAEGMQELTYSVVSGHKMVNKGRIDLTRSETDAARAFCALAQETLEQYRTGSVSGEYVVVCGGVNMDIGARPLAPLREKDSNPGRVEVSLGGVGRNIAHNLSLLGVDVCLLTALGEDGYTAQIERSCEELGIDLSHALRVKGGRTSTYVFIGDERGDMALAVSDMAICEELTSDYFAAQLSLLNGATMVVVDANLPQLSLLYLAEHCTAPLIVDPVSVSKAEKLAPILEHIHTLKPNKIEAELLSGISIRDEQSLFASADALLAQGMQRVFISLGEQGILAAEGGEKYWQKICPARMKNATGAGDALTAALAWSLLKGKSLAESARLGAAAAAIAVEGEETINPALSEQSLLLRAAEQK